MKWSGVELRWWNVSVHHIAESFHFHKIRAEQAQKLLANLIKCVIDKEKEHWNPFSMSFFCLSDWNIFIIKFVQLSSTWCACCYNNGQQHILIKRKTGIKRENITKRLENSFKNLCLQWGIYNSQLYCIHQVSSPLPTRTQLNSTAWAMKLCNSKTFYYLSALKYSHLQLYSVCKWNGPIFWVCCCFHWCLPWRWRRVICDITKLFSKHLHLLNTARTEKRYCCTFHIISFESPHSDFNAWDKNIKSGRVSGCHATFELVYKRSHARFFIGIEYGECETENVVHVCIAPWEQLYFKQLAIVKLSDCQSLYRRTLN